MGEVSLDPGAFAAVVEQTTVAVLAALHSRRESARLRSAGPLSSKNARGQAEAKWGYPFGIDGVVTIGQAARLLGKSIRTAERRIAQGHLRSGSSLPGIAKSGRVICRRSLNFFLASCEN